MRKVLIFVLLLILVAGLVGCGTIPEEQREDKMDWGQPGSWFLGILLIALVYFLYDSLLYYDYDEKITAEENIFRWLKKRWTPVSLEEVVKITGFEESQVRVIMAALGRKGLIEKDEDGKYSEKITKTIQWKR
jgi:hypothetical protein